MIFEIYIWVMAFIAVFVACLWIIVNYAAKERKFVSKLSYFPKVTVSVPIWNEAKTIVPTLKAILNQDYPRNKMQIIFVDDKSTDGSFDILKKYIFEHEIKDIKLLRHKENQGKAAAVNTALKYANGNFFWVYDADSIASKDLLKSLLLRFEEAKDLNVAAVVAVTLIKNQGNWIEKMQRIEYVMSAFNRKLMSSTDTLHFSNALTLFKTKILKEIGGFDAIGNRHLTEDLEIAMRLRYKGYRVIMCEKSNFRTHVPNTIKGMWMQRVRWFRGFIYNNMKYRKMVMNKDYGLLGMYQIPLEVFVLLTVFISLGVFGYHIVKYAMTFMSKLFIMGPELFNITFPTLKDFLLGINWIIFFPTIIVLILAFYLYFAAHSYVKEKWRFYIPSLLYIFVYPLFRSMQWLHAFILELGRAKQKW